MPEIKRVQCSPASQPLSDWEVVIAGYLVRDFLVERGSMPGLGKEDLIQEVLTHWVTQRQQYTGARGASIRTFFRKIAKNRLEDIYREQIAAKRGGKSTPLSLDQPVGREEDGAVLGDFIPDPADLAVNVEGNVQRDHILELLTPRQREIALGLERGYMLAEVARKMKVPRTTLNDELARIRRTLRKNGYGPNSVGPMLSPSFRHRKSV